MRYLARRIVLMVFVLWGVTFITFFLSRVVPGDPARFIAGPRANTEALANIRLLYGLLLSTAIGLALGVVGALRGGRTDRVVQVIAILTLSLPAFWIAMVSQVAFYSGLGLLPFGGRLPIGATAPPTVTGLFTIDSLLAGNLGLFLTSARHLILPVTVLSLALIGVMARI